MEFPHAAKNPCLCDTCAYDEPRDHGTPVRKTGVVAHWFCSQCGTGPYDVRRQPWYYRQQLPPTRDVRTHLSPDVLYFCSAGCQLRLAHDNEHREAVAAGKWATVGSARSTSGGEGDQP